MTSTMRIERLLPALLLVVAAVSGSSLDVGHLKPCDVSLFSDSWVVIMGKYGVIWADGHQLTLQDLNKLLNQRLQNKANQDKTDDWRPRWDTSKLFYTANYSHVIAVGIDIGQRKILTVGLLDTRNLGKTAYNGFRKYKNELFVDVDSFEKNTFCWHIPNYKGKVYEEYRSFLEGDPHLVHTTITADSFQRICDGRSMTFDPNEDDFVFDGVKTMSLEILDKHPTYRSKKGKYNEAKCGKQNGFRIFYNDTWHIDGKHCRDNMVSLVGKLFDSRFQPTGIPLEMVADFNNYVKNDFGNFHIEFEKENATTEAFFYNQLESGKFKLQVELFTENATKYYYHILTRLNQYNSMEEVEKCYIRKFKKEEVKNKFNRDDQPLEFPRMLLIPKKNGANGVRIPLVPITTTTTTTMTTTTPGPLKDLVTREQTSEEPDNGESGKESSTEANFSANVFSLPVVLLTLFVNALMW